MRNPAWLLLPLVLVACAPPAPETGSTETGTAAPAAPATAPLEMATDLGDVEAIKALVQDRLKGVEVDAVRATPIPGVYEVQSGMNFGYVSGDGRYLIEGDLNDLTSGGRLTENRRRESRAAMMAGVADDQTIEFLPVGTPKYMVTVFTDIDCGYCRKLHNEMAGYNKAGIGVRYVFFPRSGPDTESFAKAQRVWCAADRQGALTAAKAGEKLDGDTSCNNPIQSHFELAAQLGLRGTPAILLPDGEMIPGYQPPAALAQILAEHSGAKPAG